ncbi:unnamed protein product, partial [Staurois parvus]
MGLVVWQQLEGCQFETRALGQGRQPESRRLQVIAVTVSFVIFAVPHGKCSSTTARELQVAYPWPR